MHVEPASLREHVLGDDEAVRDGDDGVRAEVETRLEPLRLQHRDPQALGGQLGRRRKVLAAPARGRIGPRENTADVVVRGQPLQDVGAERRGRSDRERAAQRAPRTGCGRSFARAARRDSSSVRSMISTPSR